MRMFYLCAAVVVGAATAGAPTVTTAAHAPAPGAPVAGSPTAAATLAAACLPLDVNTSTPLFVVAPNFCSWNIDTTFDRDFFATDFSAPRIVYLASQLSNGTIRVGGTGNDFLWYQLGAASPCGPTVTGKYECLNQTWLDDLIALATASSSPLIFGLNIHPANLSSPPSGPWDGSNAIDLLMYVQSTGSAGSLVGLELGNEQNEFMTAEQQAGALRVLASILDDVYGPSNPARPLLYGPDTHSFRTSDSTSGNKALLTYLSDFTAAAGPLLHAVTHHEYIQIDASSCVNSTFLDTSYDIARKVVAAIRGVNPRVAVVAGEIGPHNGGTLPSPNCADNHVCGRFGSALWYSDSMGSKARAGIAAFFRQDFLGADYGLINRTSHSPSPDYWVALLWKRLVGREVLAVEPLANHTVRAYAHCGPRGASPSLTLVLINLSKEAACVGAPAGTSPGGTIQQYSLTAGAGGVESADAYLNGALLALDAHGMLPPITGQAVVPVGGVQLPPQSVTFAVVPLDDSAAACI